MVKLKKEIFNSVTNEDYNSYYNKICNLCKLVKDNRLLLVKFAYNCSVNLEQYYDIKKFPKVYKARQDCLKLVKQTIDNPKLLDCDKHKKKLDAATYAANAAAIAANDTYVAANAAANAAYTAAYAAANAAYVAAYAVAYAAANAAYAAAYAVANASQAAAYVAAYATYTATYAAAAKDFDTVKLQKIKECYYELCCLLIEVYELGSIKKFKLLFKGDKNE